MLLFWQGLLVVTFSSICYGSYYVPAKKYDVHDGLVFQWYQCSGITLAGVLCALVRNDWEYTGEASFGFYVCPEGLLMGLIFQLANILATKSVKLCGLGVYYTVHQVTNLGLTFIVGVFGPRMGLPATPPGNVWLAFAGFCLVLLGMVPVMFMEKEGPPAGGGAAADEQAPEAVGRRLSQPLLKAPSRRLEPPAGDGREPLSPKVPPRSSLDDLFVPLREPLSHAAGLQKQPSSSLAALALATAARGRGAEVPLINRDFNSRTWDGTLGRLHLPGPKAQPAMAFLGAAFAVKEDSDEEDEEAFDGAVRPPAADRHGQWWAGVGLSLVAGAAYGAMYVPQLPWKARMLAEGIAVKGFDSFFSMCVGLYLSSTAYLLIGASWMRYKGQRMEKSVLRPALLSGMIYAGGAFAFMWAMMLLPYAIGYAMGVGGGLAVSLLWSTFVFGEATTLNNRRCVAASFAGEMLGIAILGLSA